MKSLYFFFYILKMLYANFLEDDMNPKTTGVPKWKQFRWLYWKFFRVILCDWRFVGRKLFLHSCLSSIYGNHFWFSTIFLFKCILISWYKYVCIERVIYMYIYIHTYIHISLYINTHTHTHTCITMRLYLYKSNSNIHAELWMF